MKKINKVIICIGIIVCCNFCIACSFHESTPSANMYFRMAEVKFLSEDYDSAIKYCNASIESGLPSKDVDLVYKLLGASHFENKNYEEAITAYTKALEYNPENYQVWTNLGVVYRKIDEYETAIDCYEKALSINPDYAEAYSSLGSLSILNDDPAAAIDYFEKAIAFDETLAVAYGNMALALAMEKRFEEAEDALEKAKALNYKNYDAIREQIDVLPRD